MTTAWTHTALAQQIVFGAGAVDRLPELVRSVGARRLLLVTTEGRLASADGARVVRSLGRAVASTFSDVRSHVPTPLVQQALLQARRDGIDGVVSFGGGSCSDLGKAVCFFLEQEAGVPGASHVDRPAIPHVSIPTTYSGAELTPFFGMTDPGTRQKQGAGGPTSAPLIAVYDPVLTLSTPPAVSAETGMNALAHCVEAAWSRARTPEAEAIALAGIVAIAAALPEVVARPDDLEARSAMFSGACLAGRCLQNAGMGVHHGLAQLVGGRTGIPHGLANAVLLAHAVRFNAPAVPEAVARIAAALGADDAAAGVDRLRDGLGLPGRLSEAGVDDGELEAVARLSQSNHNVAVNPRPVSEADALEILRAAW
ncbi:MAG: iron-containing alcohol dehydrogenase family protein [Acidimicrobiales bacterium]|nr:iron-containing alcohol dehydrogenase family protein [Acidimicrobiales bacterium]